jgi:maleylpyruvate isomerase
LAEVDRATARLLAAAADLPADPAVPSGLPGWTRGHLLTHVARNADAYGNVITWARTGVVTPPYASRAQRDADIEAGSGRPWPVLLADVRDSSARFAEAAAALPAEAWAVRLDPPAGAVVLLPWRRLREVEVHHVDLAGAYGPANWPESFAHRLLHEVAGALGDVSLTLHPEGIGHPVLLGAGGPPEIAGPVSALAGWLTGRSSGAGLTVTPPGPLPTLPDWI